MRRYLSIIAAFAAVSCGGPAVKVRDLTTEMLTDPLAVASEAPRLSWKTISKAEAVQQLSYHIEAAADPQSLRRGKDLLWDSGEVESAQSVLIPYGGAAPDGDCWWRVKVMTDKGESPWSAPAMWAAAPDSSVWSGAWIGVNEKQKLREDENHLSARYLRKEFRIKGKVSKARLYVCGLGAARTTIDGLPVSEETFVHPMTLFKKTLYYRTYDVTDLLHKGDNAIGVVLGCGRYQGLGVRTLRGVADPRLKLCLRITYRSGRVEDIVTDGSWMATAMGPIVSDSEYDGESYDSGLELGDWDLPGYTCTSVWKQADSMKQKGELLPMPMEDLACQEEVVPAGVRAMGGGRYIVDMGQNMAGVARVTLDATAGTPVTLRYAESLNSVGDSIYTANLRDALQTDSYYPVKDGPITYEPIFTLHGFRYIEISGATSTPEVTGKVIYDRMATTGSFESSSPVLNQVYHNAYWSIRSNYRSLPMDCPQRDERQGWLNDRAATLFGEAYMFGNANLYRKWMRDIADSMIGEGSISLVSPRNWTIWTDDAAFSITFLYIADMLYSQYGDDSGICTYYPSMKKWFDRITSRRCSEGLFLFPDDEYGDWCMPPESLDLIHSQDPSRQTDKSLIHTALYYDVLRLMEKFCAIAGYPEDAVEYATKRSEVKEAFNEKYLDADGARYSNNTVTANITPLALGLVPEGLEEAVTAGIVRRTEEDFGGHVSSGIVGMRYLLRTLSAHGAADLAFVLASCDTYPSWGYMASRGATTTWELWNGDTAAPEMNSANHVMLIGDLVSWCYEDLAGIRAAEPGFARILLAPCIPEGLGWVKASYESVRGTVESEWHLDGDALKWRTVIPACTSAELQAPEGYAFSDGATTKKSLSGEYSYNLVSLSH